MSKTTTATESAPAEERQKCRGCPKPATHHGFCGKCKDKWCGFCGKCKDKWCGFCDDWIVNSCGSVEECDENHRQRERDDESDWGCP